MIKTVTVIQYIYGLPSEKETYEIEAATDDQAVAEAERLAREWLDGDLDFYMVYPARGNKTRWEYHLYRDDDFGHEQPTGEVSIVVG